MLAIELQHSRKNWIWKRIYKLCPDTFCVDTRCLFHLKREFIQCVIYQIYSTKQLKKFTQSTWELDYWFGKYAHPRN